MSDLQVTLTHPGWQDIHIKIPISDNKIEGNLSSFGTVLGELIGDALTNLFDARGVPWPRETAT
jgi:hypothetical protein